MTVLFTVLGIPAPLQHMQDTLGSADLYRGFHALGFRKGSPGFAAIENPVTPVDKAFQIYALHLAHSNQFGRESTDHTTMWSKRDAAWKAGAQWLMDTQDIYTGLDKKMTKDLAKILPEALRCQCSLELPPGSWENFPKDAMKKTKETGVVLNQLQHLGLNIKVHGIAILEGDPPKKEWRFPTDEGTLAMMVNNVKEHLQKLASPPKQSEQLGFF